MIAMDRKDVPSKVWNHMTAEPVSIEVTSTLEDAIKVMAHRGVGNLVVTNGASIGILTEREILNNLNIYGGIPDKTLNDLMLATFTKVSSESSINDAAKTMLSRKTRLLVYDDNKMVGIITTSDLAKAFFKTTDLNPAVDKVMSRDVATLESYSSILDAIKLMDKKRIGSVIVTVDGLHDGIFTERDLLTKVLSQTVDINHEVVGDYCSHFLLTARSGVKARDIAKLMFAINIKRLPITNNGRIIGIVTARDLVESFVSDNATVGRTASQHSDLVS